MPRKAEKTLLDTGDIVFRKAKIPKGSDMLDQLIVLIVTAENSTELTKVEKRKFQRNVVNMQLKRFEEYLQGKKQP